MTNKNSNEFIPIAVVGVGALFPGSPNAAGFWQNIIRGQDLIKDVPPGHWLIDDYYDPNPNSVDKTYCKRGAFLSDVELDPIEFGTPPNIIPATDTSQLLALVVAKQVLTDSTQAKYREMDLSRVSVILGASALEALQYVAARMQRPVWEKAMREFGLPESAVTDVCDRISNSYTPWQENTFPGLLGNVIAGRIANRFNLGGTNCITDAACAGSLSSLSMAVNELQTQMADMVITGGVDTLNDIIMFMCFSKTGALSYANDCRPFSDKADGTVLGEGLGMFALKRLSDAEANSDKIYAVIRGIGTSSDGRSKSIYAPVAKGQSRAILNAYHQAGYSPTTVSLIEAHGTGTKAGDVAEFSGLQLAFTADDNSRQQYCALGSVKSQIGHTKAAAGAAGLFKAVMALHHKMLPPTIKIDKPNPELNIEQSPFYVNTQLRPWVNDKPTPRRAGVSSFGFGGSNFHVALEEYTGKGKKALRLRTAPSELIIFGAETPQQLLSQCKTFLAEQINHELVYLAYSSQDNFTANSLARLAIVANSNDDLRQKLEQALTQIQQANEKSFSLVSGVHYGYAQDFGKVAFLFSGQGSQYLGMGAELAMNFDDAINKWDLASQLIKESDLTLAEVVFPKPVFTEEAQAQLEKRLMATEWAQPALAITSLIQLDLLKKLGITADCVAGHSFGELTALYAAGAMDEQALLLAARKRGELMQAAAKTPGAMLSVMHTASEVLTILKNNKLTVTPANFNSPNQLVLSGTEQEITEAEQCLQQQNISCKRLSVATAFHSKLVEPSCKPFQQFLQTLSFKETKIPVYANTTATPYPADTAKIIPIYLAEQLAKPVRFQELIENLYQNGVRTFIEIGPQAILTGLVNQCLDKREFNAINFDRKKENGMTSLWNGVAKLLITGFNLDFSALWMDYQQPELPQAKSTNFTIKLNGTNYGKPYPPPGGSKDLPKPNAEWVISEKPAVNPTSNHIQASENLDVAANTSYTESQSLNHDGEITMTQNNTYLIQMYQDLQRQLIDAHNTYQRMMAETHVAFLNSITGLSNQLSGTGIAAPVATLSAPIATPVITSNQPVMPPIAATQPAIMPVMQTTPMQQPTIMAQPMMPVATSSILPTSVQPAPAYQAQATTVATHVTETKSQTTVEKLATSEIKMSTATVAAAHHSTTNNAFNLKDLVMEIVVDKTGYPAEMLNMEMAIEADLGIDSIKRVEILSALAERAPHLPQINSNELAQLQTLGDIVNYMDKAK